MLTKTWHNTADLNLHDYAALHLEDQNLTQLEKIIFNYVCLFQKTAYIIFYSTHTDARIHDLLSSHLNSFILSWHAFSLMIMCQEFI
jgi:hypothetical protein